MTPPLHAHQHRVLVAELARPVYDGLSFTQALGQLRAEAQAWADAKTAAGREPADRTVAGSMRDRLAAHPDLVPTPFRLMVSFVAQAKFDRVHPKRRQGLVALPDGEAVAFPGGIPSLPNKLLREWIEAAWKEAGRG